MHQVLTLSITKFFKNLHLDTTGENIFDATNNLKKCKIPNIFFDKLLVMHLEVNSKNN